MTLSVPRALGRPFTRPLARPAVRLACVLAAGAALAAAAAWRVRRWASDPATPLLIGRGGAAWIAAPEPFHLSCRRLGPYQAAFRKTFAAPGGAPGLVLELEAFKAAAVLVDGRLAAEPRLELRRWKEPLRIDLSALAAPGAHELLVHVYNENAPPALLARCDALGLATGQEGWEASAGGGAWTPARLAREPRRPAIAEAFPASLEAFAAQLPWALPLFLATAAASLWLGSRPQRPPWAAGLTLTPERVRWGLLFAWALLGANNILKVPDHVGFDAFAHLDYIRHVAERRSIPLATEGWQMFQSPLYYLLSAPLHSLFAALFEPATAARLLRVVPLAAGAAQVELCHRALRLAFPARPDLRILGTLAGGLLPMNLYGSQAVGNEPLAAALSGLALVLALAVLRAERAPGARLLAALGLALGLALLAKVTALLLVPVVLGAVGWRARRDAREGASAGSGLRRGAASAALVLGVAALASGWYYGRNWIALGKPFFGGWDPERGIVWWQDPAWRTPGDILRFGECLARPVFAAAAGFWDGLYSTLWADGYLSSVISFEHRPPWSYGLMLSGVLLALLPAAAILLGTAAAFRRSSGPARDAAALSLAAVLVHLAAMVALFASVPIYSTAKATYMAGVTPGIAILAASGLDLLARRPLARAAVHGGLACWAAAAYGAYFVL